MATTNQKAHQAANKAAADKAAADKAAADKAAADKAAADKAAADKAAADKAAADKAAADKAAADKAAADKAAADKAAADKSAADKREESALLVKDLTKEMVVAKGKRDLAALEKIKNNPRLQTVTLTDRTRFVDAVKLAIAQITEPPAPAKKKKPGNLIFGGKRYTREQLQAKAKKGSKLYSALERMGKLHYLKAEK